MSKDLNARIQEAITGNSLNDLVPVFAGYLANMGMFGMVPKEALKQYVNEVIDAHYAAHSAPDSEKLQ